MRLPYRLLAVTTVMAICTSLSYGQSSHGGKKGGSGSAEVGQAKTKSQRPSPPVPQNGGGLVPATSTGGKRPFKSRRKRHHHHPLVHGSRHDSFLSGSGYVPVTAPGGGGLILLGKRPGDENFFEYEIKAGQVGDNHTLLRNPYSTVQQVRVEALFQAVKPDGSVGMSWNPLPDFTVLKDGEGSNDLHWQFKATGWTLSSNGQEKDYWVMILVHSKGGNNTCIGSHVYRYHCVP